MHSYPHLLNEAFWPWGPIHARFRPLVRLPPAAPVAHVNIVPRMGDQWVMMSTDGEAWDLPGGTLEPGESVLTAARRELIEELGAELLEHRVLGAWRCHSLAAKPYRPHLPHPDFLRVVLVGQVQLAGPPTNPEGGEDVVAVEAVLLAEAVRRFEACGRRELADLYRLAAAQCGVADD